MEMFRCTVLAMALATLCGPLSAQETAVRESTRQISVDITPQPLRRALTRFAQQAGVQLLFSEDEVPMDASAPRLVGRYTLQKALEELLADTELRAEFINPRTVAIRASASTHTSGAADSALGGGFRLARVKDGPASAGAQDMSRSAVDKNAGERTGKGIPEILVEGRRTSNADIERTEDDVQPYVVFDAEQIERSMATSVEEFLKTRLPMNAVRTTNAQITGGSFLGNQSSVDLRGLGPEQTLILVNGRRQPAISNIASIEGSFNQPDINGLPMSAIERIEVLPSTASGIYGGGATGGVINIVLKREYSGFDLRAVYDNVFDGDAAQRRIEGSGGISLGDGKTSIMVSGSYSDANRFLNSERDFGRRGVQLTLKNDRAALFSSSTPPAGYTTNIRSANGQNLVLDDGTPLGSRFTFVPVGYPGRAAAADGGAALLANADEYNFDPPRDLFGDRQSLLNNPTVSSAALSVRHEPGARVELFADLSVRSNKGRSATAPLATSVNSLPANAPNNPFLQPINVRFPNVGLDEFQAVADTDFRQIAGGGLLRLPRRWSLQAEYGWSRTRFEYTSTNPAFDNNARIALGNGTLDVLRDLNAFPLDFTPYLTPSPNYFSGPLDTTLRTVTARLAGPALELPGGPLALTALLEHRDQVASEGFQQLYDAANREPDDPYYFPSRNQKVDSAYLEMLVPLFSARNARPLAQALELQASIRHDAYTTTSVPDGGAQVPSRDGPFPPFDRRTNKVRSTDYTLGLRYAPTPAVTLRVSYGTGFLPPSIAQVVPLEDPFGFVQLADPRRENLFRFYFPLPTTTGGNPDLVPEESRSWSAGVIFTPAALRGLRLSVDYTRIEKTNEILTLQFQDIIDNEAIFSGRVMRLDLTPEDELLGYTAGEIIGFDATVDNIASTGLQAFDVQADYGWQTAFGTFNAHVLATWQPHLERQILPTSPVVDRAGFSGGPLHWRGNAGLTVERDAWTFGWNMQYYDAYVAYAADAVDSAVALIKARQGGDMIAAQHYHDLFGRYRFDRSPAFAAGLLENVDITVGIQNVLNTDPPIVASTVPQGGYSTYGDPRLRRYSLSVRRRF